MKKNIYSPNRHHTLQTTFSLKSRTSQEYSLLSVFSNITPRGLMNEAIITIIIANIYWVFLWAQF